MSTLVDFLASHGRDAQGRRHAEILAHDDAWLEARHDYIQWLFPLPEPSRAVPGSPVLTAAEIALLREDAAAQAAMTAAAARMLAFYGRRSAWLAPFDHNHLRITRIIRSLRLLRGDGAADAFRGAIVAEAARRGGRIDASARAYWAAA